MADNRIRFSIDSVFNGEGFSKASRAVKDTSGIVKNAADGVSGLSAELSGMGGTVGKVSDGLGKMFSAFMAGGPVAIAITAMTALVGKFVSWRREIEEAHRQHDKMMQDARESYERRLAYYFQRAREAALAALQASIDKGQAAIDKINQLAAAYRGLGAAEDAAGRSANAVKAAEIDLGLAFDKGVLKSDDAKKRAEIQARIDKEMLAYEDSLKAATRAQINAREHVNDCTEKYNLLKGVIDTMREAGQDTTKKEAELKKTGIELAAARQELTAATNGVQAVELRHKTTLIGLENEQVALEDAIQAREEAERKAAETAAMKAAAEDKASRQIDELTEKSKAEIAAIDRKIAAEDALIERINQLHQNARNGMAADERHTNGSFGGYDYQKDANGNISDFEDWQRAERFNRGVGANDARNASAHDRFLQDRYNRLKDRADKGKKLSDDDKRFMDQWDDYQKQRKDVKDEQKKRQELEQERKRVMDQLGKDVGQIKADLKKALEVK